MQQRNKIIEMTIKALMQANSRQMVMALQEIPLEQLGLLTTVATHMYFHRITKMQEELGE
jgi:hypothetical protein